MDMKGQFFIFGAVIILLNLFVLTHFMISTRVDTAPIAPGSQQTLQSYKSDIDSIFEKSPPYLVPKSLSTYRALMKEKTAWSYRFYDLCDNRPCDLYRVGLNDCELNLFLKMEGENQIFRMERTIPLSGPPWWNVSWPNRVGFTLTETEGKAAIEGTIEISASILPEDTLTGSVRIIGDKEERIWVNDTGFFQSDDKIRLRFSLAPSGSRTYYIYYSNTGIWEQPEYHYSDSIAVLSDSFWGQGGREVPNATAFTKELSELGYHVTLLEADQLANLTKFSPNILFLLEWEKFPMFASACTSNCEGSEDDIWLEMIEYVRSGGVIVGPSGKGFCSPYHYDGGWTPYTTGTGQYEDGCTDSRLIPFDFKAVADSGQWEDSNENISLTDEGSLIFNLPPVIDINCTKAVNTTGPRWFTLLNATGGDAAAEWSETSACLAPGFRGDGHFIFSGTGKWLYPNSTHFSPFMEGILSFSKVHSPHTTINFCLPEELDIEEIYLTKYFFDTDPISQPASHHATYDFRDDPIAVYDHTNEQDAIDNIKFADDADITREDGFIEIMDQYEGHKNVLRFFQSDSDANIGDPQIRHLPEEGIPDMIVEFYCAELGDGESQLMFREGGFAQLQIRNEKGELSFTHGNGLGGSTDSSFVLDYDFNHVKLAFNHTSNSFDAYINQQQVIFEEPFREDASGTVVDEIHLRYRSGTIDSRFDSFGIVGVDDYEEGDNLNPYGRPKDITSFATTAKTSYNTTLRVIEEMDGRTRVLELADNSDTGNVWVNNSFPPQTEGNLKFHIRWIDTTKHMWTILGNQVDAIVLRTSEETLQYHNGTEWDTITSIENNRWYSIEMAFDISNSWTLKIDGESMGIEEGYSFKESPDSIESLQFVTSDSGQIVYIDEVGYSWSLE